MANERTCTHCHRQEPHVTFRSSSGNWCSRCMEVLELMEWEARQAKQSYFQYLREHDEKPFVPYTVGEKDRRYRGPKTEEEQG